MIVPDFIWLIGLPIVAAPFVYMSGHAFNKRTAQWTGLIVLLAAWVPFVMAAQGFTQNGVETFTLGSVPLHFDGISLVLALVALGLGTIVMLYSGPYMKEEVAQEKYYAMLTALVGVMIGLGCAGDLFNLWVWFEAMAITTYLLVTFYHEQATALEAGIKYLVQSAAGSVLVLLGIALVLAQTGTLDIAVIKASVAGSPAMIAAGGLFVIGFGVKTALVPLHTWLPDAHSQAPSGISAMLSGIVIEAGLIAMLRSLSGLAGITTSWGVLLMGFGALNMVVGNLLALKQREVKRLLAYSSLSQVGYILVGLGIAAYAGEAAGAQGGLFHLVNHGLMKGLAFLAAGALLYALHLASGSHKALTVDDLAGAAQRYPLPALALSLAVLGLGGLPPLAGFMSKWQIFAAGFATQNFAIGALIVFAALNSVLSLAYYAPLVNAVYRLKPSEAVEAGGRVPALLNVSLLVLTAGVIVVGVWPALVSWLTDPAGLTLLAAIGQ